MPLKDDSELKQLWKFILVDKKYDRKYYILNVATENLRHRLFLTTDNSAQSLVGQDGWTEPWAITASTAGTEYSITKPSDRVATRDYYIKVESGNLTVESKPKTNSVVIPVESAWTIIVATDGKDASEKYQKASIIYKNCKMVNVDTAEIFGLGRVFKGFGADAILTSEGRWDHPGTQQFQIQNMGTLNHYIFASWLSGTPSYLYLGFAKMNASGKYHPLYWDQSGSHDLKFIVEKKSGIGNQSGKTLYRFVVQEPGPLRGWMLKSGTEQIPFEGIVTNTLVVVNPVMATEKEMDHDRYWWTIESKDGVW